MLQEHSPVFGFCSMYLEIEIARPDDAANECEVDDDHRLIDVIIITFSDEFDAEAQAVNQIKRDVH